MNEVHESWKAEPGNPVAWTSNVAAQALERSPTIVVHDLGVVLTMELGQKGQRSRSFPPAKEADEATLGL